MRNETHVPEGWELRSLDGLIERSDETRGELEPEPTVLSCSKDLGLVPQMELFQRRIASTDTRRYKLVHPGNFVYDPNLLWSGAISRSHEQGIGIVSPVYEVFRTKQHCSREFLFAWLKSPARLSQYRAISMGTNVRRRRADFSDFSKLQVLLPPLPEQRAIAAVLDSIDEAIERTEAVEAATERLRDALLHELLTRGVPGWHTEWKDAPGIGTIPACWDVRRLGDVLKTTTYGTSAALSGEGNISVLRMNNLQDGEVDFSDVRKADLTDQEVQELDLVKGDILFNRTNSLGLVGKIAIIRDTSPNLSFASYLVRLRVKKVRADHFWLSALLGSGTHQGRIRRLATPGVSQANINPTSLKSLAIPLPSLEEQRAIAALLESVHNVSRRAQATTDTLRTLKTSAADALLTGRVRTKQILVLSHDSLWGTSSIQTKVEGNCSNPGPQQQSVWHS